MILTHIPHLGSTATCMDTVPLPFYCRLTVPTTVTHTAVYWIPATIWGCIPAILESSFLFISVYYLTISTTTSFILFIHTGSTFCIHGPVLPPHYRNDTTVTTFHYLHCLLPTCTYRSITVLLFFALHHSTTEHTHHLRFLFVRHTPVPTGDTTTSLFACSLPPTTTTPFLYKFTDYRSVHFICSFHLHEELLRWAICCCSGLLFTCITHYLFTVSFHCRYLPRTPHFLPTFAAPPRYAPYATFSLPVTYSTYHALPAVHFYRPYLPFVPVWIRYHYCYLRYLHTVTALPTICSFYHLFSTCTCNSLFLLQFTVPDFLLDRLPHFVPF